MDQKKIRILGACLALIVWAGLTAFAWFGPRADFSYTERANLTQAPEITSDAILDGSFMEQFTEFTLDQFPLRDSFRSLKAVFHLYGLWQSDNNGLFTQDGYLEKMDNVLSQDGVDRSAQVFNRFYQNFVQGKTEDVYFTIIPAKGYYMDGPKLDLAALEGALLPQMEWAQYVDIKGSLTLEDYYYTDTHWRQERIYAVADELLTAMGGGAEASFTPQALDRPFYGVYYGQAALPVEPETMYVMESEALNGCTVTGYQKGPTMPQALSFYDLAGVETAADPYNVFLHGSQQTFVVIENPNAATDKELVLLRDSFGCSLTPLLVEDYAKITVIDLRSVGTMTMKMMEANGLLNLQNADVLFAYSAMVINNPDSFQAG